MAQINNLNANVEYNYQKNSNLNTSDKLQALAGLTLTLRDDPTKNRNINFLYPTGATTPNYGAGSPTILAVQFPEQIGINPYAGRQNTI